MLYDVITKWSFAELALADMGLKKKKKECCTCIRLSIVQISCTTLKAKINALGVKCSHG